MPETPSPKPAAYFLKLEVKNVRCFGEPAEVLDMSDGNGRPRQWTLLLGNNGTGKTTLLQLLAGCSAFGSDESLGRDVYIGNGALLTLSHYGFVRRPRTAQIRIGLAVGADIQSATPGKDDIQVRGYGSYGEIQPYSGLLPVCIGYGAIRATAAEGNSLISAISLLDGGFAIPTYDAARWLIELDYSASKEPPPGFRQRLLLAQIKKLLIGVLPEVEDIRFAAGSGRVPKPRVEFKTHYGWVPFDRLGHGYRGMTAWIVDFIAHLTERYPDSEQPTHEPAVVLIDEIDLHLHPEWQRKLIPYLSEKFPNTQFIATAHSPLIVQGAGENANIAVLRREGDRVRIINGLRPIPGARVDQILTSELFGLESARPVEFDKDMQRRKQLLTKPGKLTKAERAELDGLERKLPGLPVGETAEEAKLLADAVRKAEEILSKPSAARPKRKRSARQP